MSKRNAKLDIVDQLRFDAARCEQGFSKGVASNIEAGAKEIERLRAELAQCQTQVDTARLPDHEIRRLWREAGGEFYGPHTETGSMPEAKLLPFLRRLANRRSPTPSEDGSLTWEDQARENAAETAKVLALLQDGIQCGFDDKMVPLIIDDSSDPSVGLNGKPFLSLADGYEPVPSSFLRGLKRTFGEGAYEKALDVWQQVNGAE